MIRLLLLVAALVVTPAWGSVLLERVSSEYLSSTSATLLPGYPFLMMGWGRCTSCTSGQHTAMSINSTGDNANHTARVKFQGDAAGDPIQASSRQGTGTEAQSRTSTGYAAGTWYHWAAYFKSTTSRTAYISGGSEVENTTSSSPNAVNAFYIGRSQDGNYFNGYIAHAALYDCTGAADAAVEADIVAAASGDNPATLTACTLIEYWPLLSDANGACGELDLTVNGAGVTFDALNPTVDAFTTCPGATVQTGTNMWMLLRR